MGSQAVVETNKLKTPAKARSMGLDILKCIAMFFVVWNHSPMPQSYASVFRAVSVFFMITGFFYQSTQDKGREIEQIKKMVYMYIGANIAYFFIMALYNGGFEGILTLKNVLTHFLLGDGLTIGVLWYQHAIVVVLLIVYGADRTKKGRKILYPLVPVLILVNLLLGKYSYILFGIGVPGIYTRNFLFYGLPFFLIGDMLRCVKERWRGKRKAIFAAMCAVLVLALVEYWLLMDAKKGSGHLFITTAFLMPLIFMYAVADREAPSDAAAKGILTKIGSFMATIGREHTMVIYLVHPAVLGALKVIMQYIFPAYYELYVSVSAFVIFVASWIVSLCYGWLRKTWKAKKAAGRPA